MKTLDRKKAGDAVGFTTAPIMASTSNDAEFCDFDGLRERFAIRRSTAYKLLEDKLITGVSLRRRGQIKGRRLINVASVRAWLLSQPTDILPQMSANCREAQKVSAEKKREKKKEKALSNGT